MRVGDQDPLWAWFWMNQGMTMPFLQNRELLSWSIKISLNVLNPLKSISWIPPWGPDFTSLPVYKEINPAVPAAAKETPHKPLRMMPDFKGLSRKRSFLKNLPTSPPVTSLKWREIFSSILIFMRR
jgi:hypothetical protein